MDENKRNTEIHWIRSRKMSFYVLLLMLFTVGTPSGCDKNLGAIECLGFVNKLNCNMDEICRGHCNYPCHRTDHKVWGSEIYTYDSPICKSASHDLRISTWNVSGRDVVFKRIPYSSGYRGSVRFGFRTMHYGTLFYKNMGSFIFLNPRITEEILDVASLHRNYLFGIGEEHTQVCITSSNAAARKIKFDTFFERGLTPESLVKEPSSASIGDVEQFRFTWPDMHPNISSGGFQCIPQNSMLSIVTSIAFRKDAQFTPQTLTITANTNETVIITMREIESSTYQTSWKKDALALNRFIIHNSERKRLQLRDVQVGSAGIYSLEYTYKNEGFSRRGVTRLIVRACQRNFYGENCTHQCPQCQNGGICHDITGVCVCPPGFNGTTCEYACEPGYFGQKCNMRCLYIDTVAKHEACRGVLICVSDPFGCSCAPGYKTISCDVVCSSGEYGAGCSQHRDCHCDNNESCNIFSGLCPQGCMNGWYKIGCTTSYPVLKSPPSFINATKNTVTIFFREWNPGTDDGEGEVASYLVVFKDTSKNTAWVYGPQISPTNGSIRNYTITIFGLKPGRLYTIGVIVIDVSGKNQSENINVEQMSTLCDSPNSPPIQVAAEVNVTVVSISWKLPPRDTWNCKAVEAMIIYNSSDFHDERKTENTYYSFLSRPYVVWDVTVCLRPLPGDSIAPTCSKSFNVTTKEDSPGPVGQLSGNSTGPRSVAIKWSEPQDKNGIIRNYIVRYQQVRWRHVCHSSFDSTSRETNVTSTFLELKELRPSAVYAVNVSAVTVREGPQQTITLETKIDVPEGIPLGIRYINETDRLTWKPPLCDLMHGNVEQYHLTLRGLDLWAREEQNFSTPTTDYSFENLVPFTKYQVEIFAGNEQWLSSNYSSITFTTKPATPPPSTELNVYSKTDNTLLLSWKPPYPPHGELSRYKIVYTYRADKRYSTVSLEVVATPCHEKIRESLHCQALTHLEPNQNYEIKVFSYNKGVLVGSESEEITSLTAESIPEAPISVSFSERQETFITVEWMEPRTTNGNLTHYRVNRTTLESFDESKIGYTTAVLISDIKTLQHTFRNLSPATNYSISIEASTKVGYGPAKFIIVTTRNSVPVLRSEPSLIKTTEEGIVVKLLPLHPVGAPISAYFVIIDPLSSTIRSKRHDNTYFFLPGECNNPTRRNLKYVAAKIDVIPERGIAFTVGDGSCQNGYYNAPLEVGIMYKIGIAVLSIYKNEETYSEIKYMSEPVSLLLVQGSSHIVGILLAFLVIIAVIIGLVIYLWKKKIFWKTKHLSSMQMKILPKSVSSSFSGSNAALHEDENIDTESLDEELTNRIAVKELEDYVQSHDKNKGIKKEYMSLPRGHKFPCEKAKIMENKPKNRYGNLLSYDHSRVILDTLEGHPYSDYINANYIDGYKEPHKYIATQGPKTLTINDFWRMVWQEGSCKILMSTNLLESGKIKCEKYWPEEQPERSDHYGNVHVTFQRSVPYADYTIRTFIISVNNETREVKQFHFQTWPDHGVPMYTTPVVAYLKHVRLYREENHAPVIVHCSAGIGRTGTLILLDSMLTMGMAEGFVDVVRHLQIMRRQRSNIVENLDQYAFVYNTLVETLCGDETCIPCSAFVPKLKELRSINAQTELTQMEVEFQRVTKQSLQLQYNDIRGGHQPENLDKNRSMGILPPERSRPILRNGLHGNSYINAVYVNGYRQKDAFLVTQFPLSNTMCDFWQMVYETQSKSIVLLQHIDLTDTLSPKYWPAEGEVCTFEGLQVECQSIDDQSDILVLTFVLADLNSKNKCPPLTIKFFHLLNWFIGDTLPEASNILTLIDKVERRQQQVGKHVVTVQCFDGALACGIFCAAIFVCDKVKTEQEVDVFQAVKSIRVNRPQFIQNQMQYNFLYDLVLNYLDTFQTYANFQ